MDAKNTAPSVASEEDEWAGGRGPQVKALLPCVFVCVFSFVLLPIEVPDRSASQCKGLGFGADGYVTRYSDCSRRLGQSRHGPQTLNGLDLRLQAS